MLRFVVIASVLGCAPRADVRGGLLTPEVAAAVRPGMAAADADSVLRGLRVRRRYWIPCGNDRCRVDRFDLFQGTFAFTPEGERSSGKVMALPYFVFRGTRNPRVRACGTHRWLVDSSSSSDRPWLDAAFREIARRDRGEFLDQGPQASLAFLRRHLNTFPPELGDDPESAQVPEVWRKTESVLVAAVRSRPNDARAHRDLGDLYRMGSNMGVSGAFERSQRELSRAALLDSADVQTRYLLGSLLLRPDPSSAALARPHFEWVRRHGKGVLRRRALWGLALCDWLQGRVEQALEHARAYLSEGPADEPTLFLRETLERELARAPRRPGG